MAILFYQGDGLPMEVWVGWEWKPKLWLRGCWILFIKKSNIDKILVVRLEGLFWTDNKAVWSFFLWTLGLAFGVFTQGPTEGSNSYILLAISSMFLWTLNKVWPFNPTASWLGRQQCEAALSVTHMNDLANHELSTREDGKGHNLAHDKFFMPIKSTMSYKNGS
jgi:hypothetical protein